MITHVPVLQDSCILSRECDVGDSFLSRKEFHVANEIHSWGRLKQTAASLTLEYNKYTLGLERPRMGRRANENGPANAFFQLEIASYWDSINNEARLTS